MFVSDRLQPGSVLSYILCVVGVPVLHLPPSGLLPVLYGTYQHVCFTETTQSVKCLIKLPMALLPLSFCSGLGAG